MALDRYASGAATAAGSAGSRFSFSTDWIPERDRLAFFKEEFSKILALDVEPLDGNPKQVMHMLPAGPVLFSGVRASPIRYVRGRDHLKDGDESFLFFIRMARTQHLSHNGHEITVRPGDAGLLHHGRTGDGYWPDGGSAIAVRIEGNALRALVKEPERLAGRRIDRTRPGLALLKGHLRTYSGVKDTLTPDLARSFGYHVVDLVAAVLGPTRDGAAQAEAGGIRAARLNQVLEAISGRACDPRFSVETVAGELGVTPRYIQRILEPTGSTFSEHVTEQRLRRAQRLLGSGHCRSRIAEIALEAGFNDLAHFHRVFRRRFGATPAAMRGAALPA